MKLSVVIPAHDEAGTIEETLAALRAELEREAIEHEIVVVNDGSRDATPAILERIASDYPELRAISSRYDHGFGLTVRAGLEAFSGDVVAIVMADGSDSPADLVTYHRLIEGGYDCAFGTRFSRGGTTSDYPRAKLVLNRIANLGIAALFGHRYDDTTNAFKAYRREVIEHIQPLLSNHFNLTVELPLKAIIRGHSYAIVPIDWRNRTAGTSKFAFQEMGGRYIFLILYAFLELHLSRGDYRRGIHPRSSRWRAGVPDRLDFPRGTEGVERS